MESGINSLTKWRIEKARRTILQAEIVYEQGLYEFCLNRAYYAVFYAMQAANSLNRYDSRKHSGVISYFRMTFLKTGLLDAELSKTITDTSMYREKADYEDMYEATQEVAKYQVERAKAFVNDISKYLESITEEDAKKEEQECHGKAQNAQP